ncbi:MAG: DUF885 domain-containing protein [Planctomycetes bacterium]|nr:DUF885 domain-containing protein [Planctomycetota bacterium]
MRRVSYLFAVSIGIAIMTPTAKADPHADLHKLFDDYWQARMKRSPERATYLGDHRFDDRLTDYSEAACDDDRALFKQFADRLQAVPRDTLSAEDHLNADLFQHTIDDFFLVDPYPEHLMPIKQQESFHIALGLLQQYHKFDTTEDCANYAKRLRLVEKQVDDMIACMDKGIRLGIVRPKITIGQTLPQIDAMIAREARKSVLWPTAFSDATKKTVTDEKARADVEAGVRSATAALTNLRDYLQRTYLPKCRDSVGYGQLPNGKAWYQDASRVHTTTDLDPATIHQIGLDELKRIHADMLEIAREVSFEGDLRAFIEKMRTDPAQHNKTPAEIMRRHAEILRRSDANLPKLFGVLPKIPYELKEMEPFRAEAAPEAYYYNAPDDGSRPAYFYVNTVRPETRPIYTMESLAYHEAQPGHHFQLAIAQEKKNWPMFRRFESINAYIEGWALYSELLGYQLGGYNDPYSRFGQLTYDTWRSSRLVVDTGMHAMGWTREKAIQFMKDNTALSEQNIISEVDRYIAWPGQALGYKIGQLEILKLRREAETRLSRKFDIRAFHDELLCQGSLPLDLLRARMLKWIDMQLEKK